MRTYCQHIILFALLSVLSSCSQEKKTNWGVSLEKNSKDPYGCYIAYHMLEEMFPGSKVASGRNVFTEINKVLGNKSGGVDSRRLSIVVSRTFHADSLELDKIIRYINKGNTICILAENYSENILNYFHHEFDNVYARNSMSNGNDEDTFANQKTTIFFNHREYDFRFSGLPIRYAFGFDTTFKGDYYYLGYSGSVDSPNIRMVYEGNGSLMICRNPITMTNHFLLQNDNKKYVEYFFSYFGSYPSAVTWYTMYNRRPNEDNESDLSKLLNFPPLFYAFLLLIMLLLFFTVFESKRRQKHIPILPHNTNSSLEFTETVGMLYYNKKDHKNLSDKMILHYLETIRSKYGLKTKELDDEFANLLAQKTTHAISEITSFLAYIRYIRDSETITETDIKHLYHQLQKFM